MTPEQLKDHRRAICEALIEGKQCQMHNESGWADLPAHLIAYNLFDVNWSVAGVRIKPEPRSVWVGWKDGEYPVLARTCYPRPKDDSPYRGVKWQLVVEEVK